MLSRKKKNIRVKTNRASNIINRIVIGIALLLGAVSNVSASTIGKILIRTHNGSDWDLYIMNEDGTDLKAIDTTNNVSHGDFSPDGDPWGHALYHL